MRGAAGGQWKKDEHYTRLWKKTLYVDSNLIYGTKYKAQKGEISN